MKGDEDMFLVLRAVMVWLCLKNGEALGMIVSVPGPDCEVSSVRKSSLAWRVGRICS